MTDLIDKLIQTTPQNLPRDGNALRTVLLFAITGIRVPVGFGTNIRLRRWARGSVACVRDG